MQCYAVGGLNALLPQGVLSRSAPASHTALQITAWGSAYSMLCLLRCIINLTTSHHMASSATCAGEVLSSWGAGALYMPHMITVDRDGHVWVVDVALHQAIKFSATGQKLLELGKHLEPGHDDGRLCKPTHVCAHLPSYPTAGTVVLYSC